MGSRLCFRCWLLAALRIPLLATVVMGGWAAAPFPPTGRLLPLRLIAVYCFRFSVGRTSPSGGGGWQRGSRRTFRRRPTPPDAAVRSGGRHGGLGVPLYQISRCCLLFLATGCVPGRDASPAPGTAVPPAVGASVSAQWVRTTVEERATTMTVEPMGR